MKLDDFIRTSGIDDGAYQAGKLVHELRLVHGLTQKEMAKKVGVQQEAIARVESMEHYPTIRFLEKVCKAFGVRLQLYWKM